MQPRAVNENLIPATIKQLGSDGKEEGEIESEGLERGEIWPERKNSSDSETDNEDQGTEYDPNTEGEYSSSEEEEEGSDGEEEEDSSGEEEEGRWTDQSSGKNLLKGVSDKTDLSLAARQSTRDSKSPEIFERQFQEWNTNRQLGLQSNRQGDISSDGERSNRFPRFLQTPRSIISRPRSSSPRGQLVLQPNRQWDISSDGGRDSDRERSNRLPITGPLAASQIARSISPKPADSQLPHLLQKSAQSLISTLSPRPGEKIFGKSARPSDSGSNRDNNRAIFNPNLPQITSQSIGAGSINPKRLLIQNQIVQSPLLQLTEKLPAQVSRQRLPALDSTRNIFDTLNFGSISRRDNNEPKSSTPSNLKPNWERFFPRTEQARPEKTKSSISRLSSTNLQGNLESLLGETSLIPKNSGRSSPLRISTHGIESASTSNMGDQFPGAGLPGSGLPGSGLPETPGSQKEAEVVGSVFTSLGGFVRNITDLTGLTTPASAAVPGAAPNPAIGAALAPAAASTADPAAAPGLAPAAAPGLAPAAASAAAPDAASAAASVAAPSAASNAAPVAASAAASAAASTAALAPASASALAPASAAAPAVALAAASAAAPASALDAASAAASAAAAATAFAPVAAPALVRARVADSARNARTAAVPARVIRGANAYSPVATTTGAVNAPRRARSPYVIQTASSSFTQKTPEKNRPSRYHQSNPNETVPVDPNYITEKRQVVNDRTMEESEILRREKQQKSNYRNDDYDSDPDSDEDYRIADLRQTAPPRFKHFLENLYDPESETPQKGALLSDYEAWILLRELRSIDNILLQIYAATKSEDRLAFEKTLLYT